MDTGWDESSTDEGDEESGGGSDEGGETTDELRTPGAGEVIITEILADPSMVEDVYGEWIELTNLTEDVLDLSGHLIVDNGRNSFAIPEGVTLPAGESMVVGRSADQLINGGVTVHVVSGTDMTLNNDLKVLAGD